MDLELVYDARSRVYEIRDFENIPRDGGEAPVIFWMHRDLLFDLLLKEKERLLANASLGDSPIEE